MISIYSTKQKPTQQLKNHSIGLISAAIIGFSVLFSGCTSISTASNIPQNIQQKLSTQQPIISYFSPKPNEQDCGCASSIDQSYSMVPIEDGYYRSLLGRDQAGRFLVQDFYQKTKTPQSSPFWIIDPMGLFSFSSEVATGPLTLYFPNGKVSYQGTRDDNGREVGKSQSFYTNGQLGLENEMTDEKTQRTLWYSNGTKAAEMTLSNDEMRQFEYKVWDNNAQLVDNEQQKERIIDAIYTQLDEDIN